MTPSPDFPREAIPRLELECVGGPLDGERRTLHELQPVYDVFGLVGYLGIDGPEPMEQGTYVVTAALRLEWEPREVG